MCARADLAGFYWIVSFLPLVVPREEADDGRMVPAEMLKEMAYQRSAELREFGADAHPRTARRGLKWAWPVDRFRPRHRRILARRLPRPSAAA